MVHYKIKVQNHFNFVVDHYEITTKLKATTKFKNACFYKVFLNFIVFFLDFVVVPPKTTTKAKNLIKIGIF